MIHRTNQLNFQQTVKAAILKPAGSRQLLIMTGNISRFIADNIMVSGISARIVIPTQGIMPYSLALLVIRQEKPTMNIREYQDINITVRLVLRAIPMAVVPVHLTIMQPISRSLVLIQVWVANFAIRMVTAALRLSVAIVMGMIIIKVPIPIILQSEFQMIVQAVIQPLLAGNRQLSRPITIISN
jgi:hypothetical protein